MKKRRDLAPSVFDFPVCYTNLTRVFSLEPCESPRCSTSLWIAWEFGLWFKLSPRLVMMILKTLGESHGNPKMNRVQKYIECTFHRKSIAWYIFPYIWLIAYLATCTIRINQKRVNVTGSFFVVSYLYCVKLLKHVYTPIFFPSFVVLLMASLWISHVSIYHPITQRETSAQKPAGAYHRKRSWKRRWDQSRKPVK